MPKYGFTNAVKATGQSLQAIVGLTNSDNAARIVPQDTKFVVVIEAIARKVGDSFYENDVMTVPLSIKWVNTPEGISGRFIGYISCSDSRVRIQQVLDIGSAASGQEGTQADQSGNLGAQTLLDEEFANVTLSMEQGAFVLANATHRFKLLNPYQLKQTDGRFESSAAGFQGGFSPLFKYLSTHGVNTDIVGKSNKAATIILIVAAIFFIAVFAYGSKK